MKTINNISQKKIYCIPLIKRVKLDNQISLQLESNPPIGPDESFNGVPKFSINDPFKA